MMMKDEKDDSYFEEMAKQVFKSESLDDMKAFLLSYRRFGTPMELFNIWVAQFKLLLKGHKSNNIKTQTDRITQFLYLWMDQYFAQDFTRKKYSELLELVAELGVEQQNQFKLLLLKADKRLNVQKQNSLDKLPLSGVSSPAGSHSPTSNRYSYSPGTTNTFLRPSATSPSPRSSLPSSAFSSTSLSSNSSSPSSFIKELQPEKENSSKYLRFLDMSSRDVAIALTAYEFELFKKVHPSEFLHKIEWVKSSDPPELLYGNILALIQRFNEVGFWVATEVVSAEPGKHQKAVLEKFIRVAKKCEQLNNFNSVMEILSGLNNTAVQRMKRLWLSLSDTHRKLFQELEEMMSAQHNFKNYYNELNKRQPPVLPYFGMFLREYTFIYTGNQAKLPDGHPNFELMRLFSERATLLLKFQENNYHLTPNESIVNFFKELVYIEDDDELYKLSLRSQPSMWVNVLEESQENIEAQRTMSDFSGGDSESYDHPSLSLSDEDYSSEHSFESDVWMRRESVASLSDSDIHTLLTPQEPSAPKEPSTIELLLEGRSESPKSKIVAVDIGNRNVVDSTTEEKNLDQISHNNKKFVVESPGKNYLKRSVERSRSAEGRSPERKLSEKKLTVGVHKKVLNSKCNSISVPSHCLSIFSTAERMVDKYFGQCNMSKVKGTIGMLSERYLFIRAASLGKDFSQNVPSVFSIDKNSEALEFSQKFVFDLGYSLGKNDAKALRNKLNIEGLLLHTATGLIHMSYMGLGFVNLHSNSNFTPENFSLQFDLQHSCQLEHYDSDSERTQAACILSSGYCSGWCSEALGMSLICTEVLCKSKGDNSCTFLMASSANIDDYVLKFIEEKSLSQQQGKSITIPTFLETKSNKIYAFDNLDEVKGASGKDHKSRSSSLGNTSLRKSSISKRTRGLSVVPNVLYPANRDQIEAEKKVSKHVEEILSGMQCDSKEAKITMVHSAKKERFICVRCKSLSSDFCTLMKRNSSSSDKHDKEMRYSMQYLFDLGKALGKSDAAAVANSVTPPLTPIEKLYVLPISMKKTGWGKLEISLGGVFKMEEFFITLTLENSAEACSWNNYLKHKNSEEVLRAPMCAMTAGYISGWSTCVFDTPLATVEVKCHANHNNTSCVFLVAPPDKIEEHVRTYLDEAGRLQDLGHFYYIQQSHVTPTKQIEASGFLGKLFGNARKLTI